MSDFTTKEIALAVLPKITGTISACLSAVIVCIVLRSQKRRNHTFHRLMAALSLVDTSSSISFAMSTWPTPHDSGAVWAVGTRATCQTQAFFIHMAVASILYNLSLSCYYLLVIRFNWKRDSIKRIEPFMHALPLLWATVTGFAAYFMGAYDFANLWCWIKGADQHLRWAFYYGPLALCYVVIFINCYLTWLHVHTIERSVVKFRFGASVYTPYQSSSKEFTAPRDNTRVRFEPGSANYSDNRRRELGKSKETASRQMLSTKDFNSVDELGSRRVANDRKHSKSRIMMRQCFLYAGGFYVTWTAMMLSRFLQLFGITSTQLLFIAAICAPMQGLPNILVYLLPEFRRLRRKHPDSSWIRVFFSLFVGIDNSGTESCSRSGDRGSSKQNPSMQNTFSHQSNTNKAEITETAGASDTAQRMSLADSDYESSIGNGEDDDFHDLSKRSFNAEHNVSHDSGFLTCLNNVEQSTLNASKRSPDGEHSAHHGSLHGSDYLTCAENAEQSTLDSGFMTAWMERRCGSAWAEQSSISSHEDMSPSTPSTPTTTTTRSVEQPPMGVTLVTEMQGGGSISSGSYV